MKWFRFTTAFGLAHKSATRLKQAAVDTNYPKEKAASLVSKRTNAITDQQITIHDKNESEIETKDADSKLKKVQVANHDFQRPINLIWAEPEGSKQFLEDLGKKTSRDKVSTTIHQGSYDSAQEEAKKILESSGKIRRYALNIAFLKWKLSYRTKLVSEEKQRQAELYTEENYERRY